MLKNKSTKVFRETECYFTSGENGISRIIDLYRSLNLNRISLGCIDHTQSIFRKSDLLLGLLLLPLYSLTTISCYAKHPFARTMEASKNTFYRFKNNFNVNWRGVLYKVNKKLLKQVKPSDSEDDIRCLIVDDSDFEKTTSKTEHISKIWSHVTNQSILGFKGLFLGLWDSKSFFALDFSLHKEKGKNKKTPFGLSAKQRKSQYRKSRPEESHGSIREGELLVDKISNAIEMVKRAVKNGINANYVLVDSWFFCERLLIGISKLKMHVLGMVKMGNAKYTFEGKNYTAKELAYILKKRKKVKRVSSLNLYSAEVVVEYKSTSLKLFFCKNSKRGKWHLLGTTNCKLGIKKAYEIYSIRWSIEVFFKEAKQFFGLGKSQSQDFDAQIADNSIAAIVYNVFSLAKRYEAYESLGGLFTHAKDQMTELTICSRIWGFILEIIECTAEIIDSNLNDLLVRLFKTAQSDNKILRLMELRELDSP